MELELKPLLVSAGAVCSFELEPVLKPAQSSRETQAAIQDPEVTDLQEQLESLNKQLKQMQRTSSDNEKKHLELLNTQRQTILDFEQRIATLKAENDQMEYKSHASLNTAEKARVEQITKLNKELAVKANQIDILKLENQQMELEVERIRINEKQIMEALTKLEQQSGPQTLQKETADASIQAVQRTSSQEVQVDLDEEEPEQETRCTPREVVRDACSDEDMPNMASSRSVNVKDTHLEDLLKQKELAIHTLETKVESLTFQLDEMYTNEAKILEEAEKIAEQFKSREISYKSERNLMEAKLAALQSDNEGLKDELKQGDEQRIIDAKIHANQLEQIKNEHALEMSEQEDKYHRQLDNIQKCHESGKESVLSQVYEDHKNEIESLSAKHAQSKKSLDDKIFRLSNECKQLKEEVERKQRMANDKLNKAVQDAANEREIQELNFKQKMDAASAKAKKDLKAAQEKHKVDLLNATDSLKNEHAKFKAELERDKKKLLTEHEDELNLLKQQLEEEFQAERQDAKDKSDRLWKKKLQDKETLWQGKFEEIEKEIEDLTEAHRQELRQEKQRIESRLRE